MRDERCRVTTKQHGQETRVSGYAVRFTDENDRDLHNEYFDKRTYFWDVERPLKGIPILIDHAFDSKFKGLPVGIVDFAEEDEIGIWIEGKLHDRQAYIESLQNMRRKGVIDVDDELIPRIASNIQKAVKMFFDTGETHWSSGAHPQIADGTPDGRITSWPMIEVTAVMEPAEPDGTEIKTTTTSVRKALHAIDDVLLSIQTAKGAEGQAADRERDAGNVEPGAATRKATNNITEDAKAMNEEQMKEFARMVAEQVRAMYEDDKMIEVEIDEEELVEAAMGDEKMSDEDEKMSDEEKAEMIVEKMWERVRERIEQRERTRAAARRASEKAAQKIRLNQEPEYLPSATGEKHAEKRSGSPQIQVRSKFERAGWSPEDFSFALALAGGNSAGRSIRQVVDLIQGDEAAFRKGFADSALKAYSEGRLNLPGSAVKTLHTMKDDEVMYSTLSGFGDENVPTVWSDSIWDKPRVPTVSRNLLRNIEMPSNPYEYPVESTDPTVYFVAETADSASLSLDASAPAIPRTQIGTEKVTFTAKKLGMHIPISAELQEDGITRLIPEYRAQAEKALLEAQDFVVFNGDTATTGNINSDGETITATDRKYQAYDGLIHQALVLGSTSVDAGGSGLTLQSVRNTRALLGPQIKGNPNNLAIICDPSTYVEMLNIDQVQTVDKYGDQATVITGELGRLDGMRIFMTDQMVLADADGKVTQTSNVVDRGRLLIVHYPSWLLGYRRRISQNLTFLPYYDAHILTMTVRNSLTGRTYSDGAQQATDDTVAILYNIGV